MATIDIRTTQNVTIEYELASLRERLLAFFIDLLIVGVTYFVLLFVLISLAGDVIFSSDSGLLAAFVFGLLPIIGLLAYQFFSEVATHGQSLGKKSVGIKVVRLDGAEPSLTDYLLRAVFHIVESIASLGVLAAFFISSSSKNQRMGDLAAGTTVIRTRSQARFRLEDILKISSIEKYQPIYPEVRRLSEQDMLLIKQIITRYRQFPNAAHQQAVDEATKHLMALLDISVPPNNKIEFLKTLIRDYIVLTR